jgi:pSer/pThr/pTyr-binding forkhead associated (FHA) protein
MARLEFKLSGFERRVVELKLGITRLGRAPDSDVRVDDLTVSATHCEVLLGCGRVSVRDCGSTNGTFVDGIPVQDAVLLPGETLRLGDVELVVADTEIPISIPKFEPPTAAPPVLLSNGSATCRRHRLNVAVYRCQHCHELLCDECIHRLRRRGGKLLCLCPLCSYPAEAIGGEDRKKKSFLNRLRETTKLLLNRFAFARR